MGYSDIVILEIKQDGVPEYVIFDSRGINIYDIFSHEGKYSYEPTKGEDNSWSITADKRHIYKIGFHSNPGDGIEVNEIYPHEMVEGALLILIKQQLIDNILDDL